jgi:toxin ParE1/3/4
MTYRLIREASEEISEAISYYETQEAGLGGKLRDEVEALIDKIVASPLLWRERQPGYRRANCKIFPYYVIYCIRGDVIFIVAIGHGARRPGYWRQRKVS